MIPNYTLLFRGNKIDVRKMLESSEREDTRDP